jgi:hypothetical protein
MHYIQILAEAFDSLTQEQRNYFRHMLNHGLTPEAVNGLLGHGLGEERAFGTIALPSFSAKFVESARLDLSIFQNEPTRTHLTAILSDLRATRPERRFTRLKNGLGLLISEGPFRIVLKPGSEPSDDVVLAIAVAGINPLQKVWRYFDGRKAADLIESGTLYLCRLDKLVSDPLEGRLPHSVRRSRVRIFEEIFGPDAAQVVEMDQQIVRGTTYVSCWTRRDYESFLAWQHYCPSNGGFAVQSTWRRIAHVHSVLRAKDDRVFCRAVGYLDPTADEMPDTSHGEEVFWKASWFADEFEIRFAIMRHISGEHDAIVQAIQRLPTGERLDCPLELLTERILLNPFSSTEQRILLRRLIEEKRPELVQRVAESAVEHA